MIAAILDEPRVLDRLRADYRGAPIPAVVVPRAIEPSAAAGLRTRLRAAGFKPRWIADRGRYALNDSLRDDRLFDLLRTFAQDVAREELSLLRADWQLSRAGDYALLKDCSPAAARLLELTADFSAASSGAGEIVYTDGRERLFVLPQMHESVAVVERSPRVLRYQRYIPLSGGPVEVFRLRLQLSP